MKMTRRRAGRLLLAAPLAAASAGPVAGLLGSGLARAADPAPPAAPAAEPPAAEPKAEPLADLLAGQEEGLTAEERARVKKDIAELEASLRKLRDFPVANDVPPAGTFMALKSKRRS
jgi:hypothetical protein